MDTELTRTLYETYASSLAYVEIENSKGDLGIGSAYHIGEGVFVTARHVVDVPKIRLIATTEFQYDSTKASRTRISAPGQINIVKGPFFHPDPDVDVACFVSDNNKLPSVPLGTHLDDWIGTEMVLHSTLIMGYPRLPFTKEPVLVASIAQVNAVIDKYTGGHPHFIMSSMARGGFSGGLCLNEYGFSMGIITESLIQDNNPTELGYLSVISVEPIYVCLSHYNLMPQEVKVDWMNNEGKSIWDKE